MIVRRAALAALLPLLLGIAGCDAPAASPVAPTEARLDLTGGPTVDLQGWDAVRAGTPCIWNAAASGGTAPLSYAWTFTGGDGSGYGATFIGQPDGGAFRLKVVVTDADGRTASDAIDGTSSLSDPQCPILY